MRPARKSGYILLTLFFLCTSLIPYSHCSAYELLPFESGGSGCEARQGSLAQPAHSYDLHEHDSDKAYPHHFHFLLEAGNSAFRPRFDQDPARTAETADVKETFSFPDARSVITKSIEAPKPILFIRFRAVPSGLSPPV